MTPEVLVPKGCETVHPADAGGLRYVARQPILDLRGRVHGYELLFRSGVEAFFHGDGDLATRTMLDNTVMFGIEKLTGGLPAFVNCTSDSLTDDLVLALPSGMTVLEILENIEPTPSLIGACRKLKSAGFRLALDDFVWKPELQPLLQLADYVKVDFCLTDAAGRRDLLKRLHPITMALVAEKVETQEEYVKARAEGFTMFQGYYFCRPVLLKNRKVPANRLSQIEILNLLHEDSYDLLKMTHLVKRDTSLTYRLLRLINSPTYALRDQVRSVQAALMAVGEDTFRRIAVLAITSEFSLGQPPEVLRMAFVRGKFCELAASLCALDSTEQYLLGMLSLLPAMLQMPIQELTPALALRKEIRRALEGEPNSERVLLHWLECHEQGDWAMSDAVVQANSLPQTAVIRCYSEAVEWAEEALRSVI
jgi:EAL and modified HD-GYP domain-containing signal transduction protein